MLASLHGRKCTKRDSYNQYVSMQKAIETCMPTTIHKWCICHIMKKRPKIEQEMSHVVWNSFTKYAFDKN
ncbi:hypothetical protein Ahy_B08g089637 isoform B [Arachis hypogaea]|uniref:Protein FAR1-RELATED SEQUENCE n=1 Tax=Arachis hypogaea TaxID=3818 RepID=A0A444XYF0_ARAHY|nr:hypothetical protein Ahy_B08g089637 isoform B [Arachis hypogaea]